MLHAFLGLPPSARLHGVIKVSEAIEQDRTTYLHAHLVAYACVQYGFTNS